MDERTTAVMLRVTEGAVHELKTTSIYLQARQQILAALADGLPHRSHELVDLFEPDANCPSLTTEAGTEPHIDDLVHFAARRAAAIEALGLLYADGLVVAVSPQDNPNVSGGVSGGFDALRIRFDVSWVSGSSRTSGRGMVFVPLPQSPPRVRLARTATGAGSALDYESFASDLAPLGLDDRTLRALGEAFRAFRGGLYLSTAVLCGTVIEGAVRTLAPKLIPVVTSPGATKDLSAPHLRTVAKRLVDVLRSSAAKELPARAEQLASHIHRFVDLRNYGAHTGAPDAGLERWFENDLQGAMLLADARHTLLMIHEAVEDRLAAG